MNERSLRFGPGDRLVGTVTVPEPHVRRADGLGLLLLNAGLVHRVGPHRINVKLARLAAQRGVPSIRFDLSGRGDSGPGDHDRDMKSQKAAEIRAASSTLGDRTGAHRMMLFGICSGADDGLMAALADPAIVSLVLFDPYVYPTLRWRARIVASKWRKFGLMEGLAYWREMRSARRAGGEDNVLGNFGRDVPPIAEFARSLRALCDRGVAVRLVYSGSVFDGRDYDAQRRMLLEGHALDGRVQTEFMPNVDHVVTSVAAQREVLSRLDDWLAAVPGR